MRGSRTTLAAAVLLAVQSGPVCAQVVRGHLVGTGTERPVHGALVSLIDPTGARHAIELSDASGRFVVEVGQPGIYRLEVRRVGYRTVISPALQLFRGDTLQYEMEVTAETVQLPAVIVEEQRRCSLLPELGSRTAATWEEARKALDITAWTEARGALRFHIVKWNRELEPEYLDVESEEREESVSLSREPFRSLPAERLSAGGYVQPSGSDFSFYAPDAEVLLSEEFLKDHCFRLEAGEDEEDNMVGLVFEPTSDRVLPEVTGVLWLDRGTAELRHLEFRYTNLQYWYPDMQYDVPRHTAAGYVAFERLRTGAWIVRRWWIRMPVIQLERRRVSPIAGAEVREFLTVTSVREEGGEVTATFSRRGEQLDGELTATLLGTVFDSTTGAPLAGAAVRLTDTDFVARTDGQGTFRIYDVPEGSHVVQFTHPRYEAWNSPFPSREISLTKGLVTSVDLAVPSVESASAMLCPSHRYQESDGLAVGFVADGTTGVRLPDATVFFEWTQPGARADAPRGHTEATTDAQGSYRACGLPPGTAITVWATAHDRWAEPVILRVERSAIVQQNLTVDLR
jgi:hypothetical protein